MEQKNKIIMLGDSGVGKTALVSRWLTRKFVDCDNPTIGAQFSQTSFEYAGDKKVVQIWDTSGEEKYRAMSPIYSRNAFGAILVFDITCKASFAGLSQWISIARDSGDIPIVVVGNKSDLNASRKVEAHEALTFCQGNNMRYIEASAQTGEGVDQLFSDILSKAFEERVLSRKPEQTTVPETESEIPPHSRCLC